MFLQKPDTVTPKTAPALLNRIANKDQHKRVAVTDRKEFGPVKEKMLKTTLKNHEDDTKKNQHSLLL